MSFFALNRARTLLGLFLPAILLGLSACGPSSPAPAAAPPPTSPANPPPASPASPTSGAVTAPSPAGPSTASSPSAKAPSPVVGGQTAGETRLTIADGTEARFRAREQLANRPSPNEAVGTTNEVTGQIVLAQTGALVSEQSKVVVDLRNLATDQRLRDRFIKENTLEVAKFPNVEFTPREVQGLPAPLPTSGEATFQMSGDLTVHGTTRPATWDVKAQFGPEQVVGVATTTVQLPSFGMEKPRVASVLSIEDDIKLEIEVTASRQG